MATPPFIAMNRFKVVRGSEDAFEALWRSRESHLDEVRGFVSFRLLRAPAGEDYTLFASHTLWKSEEAFVAWTQSEQFRKAHANANDRGTQSAYIGHPEFEGFSVVLQIDADGQDTAPAIAATAPGVA